VLVVLALLPVILDSLLRLLDLRDALLVLGGVPASKARAVQLVAISYRDSLAFVARNPEVVVSLIERVIV